MNYTQGEEAERLVRTVAANYIRTLADQIEQGNILSIKLEWSKEKPSVHTEVKLREPIQYIAIPFKV